MRHKSRRIDHFTLYIRATFERVELIQDKMREGLFRIHDITLSDIARLGGNNFWGDWKATDTGTMMGGDHIYYCEKAK